NGVVHCDHFSRIDKLDTAVAVAAPAAAFEFRLNLVGLAHQNYLNAKIAGRSQRAINLYVRRMVTSHCVENDFARQRGLILRLSSHWRSILGFFYLHHLAAVVIAAFGTDAMGHAGFAAVG